MAASSPAIAASMKAGVVRGSRGREQESLFSTSTDFHQFKMAVSLHSVADGVNHLVTVPLIIYQLEKASTQLAYTRSGTLRLLNWAKINSLTNLGVFSCKQTSWGDQSLWMDRNASIFIFPRHGKNLRVSVGKSLRH